MSVSLAVPHPVSSAMSDPELMGGMFADASWAKWKAFVAALEGAPLSDGALAAFQHHTGRQTPPQTPFREAAAIVGRRGGKTRALAAIATIMATCRDWRPYLAPGERATVAIIASDRRQARSAMRFVRGMLLETPLLRPLVQKDEAEFIELTNSTVVEVHTCSLRAVRGYSLACVLADECAFWRDDLSANPDSEVLAALRPGLSNLPGSLLLLASSPYAKRGELYRAFRENFGRDDARVLVWRGTSLEMNSALDPGVVQRAYEDDPASAASEYGAEWRDDIAAFVSREVIEACVATGVHEVPPTPGGHYIAFCDPSGGSSDAMTLAIAHLGRDGIAVLDAVRIRKAPFSPESVVAEFAGTLRNYGINRVTGDRYAAEWPVERFRVHGIAYEVSDKNKNEIYQASLPLLNAHRVALLDNRQLVNELASLERRTARGGKDSVDHPVGAKDDLANATLGALLLASAFRAISWNFTAQDLHRIRVTGQRQRILNRAREARRMRI